MASTYWMLALPFEGNDSESDTYQKMHMATSAHASMWAPSPPPSAQIHSVASNHPSLSLPYALDPVATDPGSPE